MTGAGELRLKAESLGRDASEATGAVLAATPIWRLLRRDSLALPQPLDVPEGGDDDDDDDADDDDVAATDDAGHVALRDVSFEIRAGEALGVVGPREAGPGTLMQIISGLFPPDRGRAVVYGRRSLSSTHNRELIRPEWTVAAQTGALATVAQVPRRDRRRWRADLVAAALCDEAGNVEVSDVTEAMIRLAIMASFDPTADVLVIDAIPFDEPVLRARCEQRLAAALERGAGAIIWLRNRSALVKLCDHAIRLDDGRIVETGATAALAARARHGEKAERSKVPDLIGFSADAAILGVSEPWEENGTAELVIELETASHDVQIRPQLILRGRIEPAEFVADAPVLTCPQSGRYTLSCALTPPAGVAEFDVDLMVDVEVAGTRGTIGRRDVAVLAGGGEDFQLDATDAVLGDAEEEILEANWSLERRGPVA